MFLVNFWWVVDSGCCLCWIESLLWYLDCLIRSCDVICWVLLFGGVLWDSYFSDWDEFLFLLVCCSCWGWLYWMVWWEWGVWNRGDWLLLVLSLWWYVYLVCGLFLLVFVCYCSIDMFVRIVWMFVDVLNFCRCLDICSFGFYMNVWLVFLKIWCCLVIECIMVFSDNLWYVVLKVFVLIFFIIVCRLWWMEWKCFKCFFYRN